jgi:hypothetical protein
MTPKRKTNGQLEASRNPDPASFNAFDRAKTGSARKTPKSDIAMLAHTALGELELRLPTDGS